MRRELIGMAEDRIERAGGAPKFRIEGIKTWIEVGQGIATIIAVILGAWWFLEQRSISKNIRLDQTISWQRAIGEDHTNLVMLEVHATNIGKIRVDLAPGLLEVFQINPRTPAPLALYKTNLEATTLEPGESAQALFHVLAVYDSVSAIEVHSCYEVPGSAWKSVDCAFAESHPDPNRKNKYWNLLSIASIGANAPQTISESSVH